MDSGVKFVIIVFGAFAFWAGWMTFGFMREMVYCSRTEYDENGEPLVTYSQKELDAHEARISRIKDQFGLRHAHVKAIIFNPGCWFPTSDVQRIYNDSIARGETFSAWHLRYEAFATQFLKNEASAYREPFDTKSV